MVFLKKTSKEFWVGLLVLGVAGVLLGFGWLLGIIAPFRSEAQIHVLYGFAGGVEVGSPVRVSGVKVGRVVQIEFLGPPKLGFEGATLRLTLKISWKAMPTIRKDSRFYVNLAGIIGERYVEIAPGSPSSAPIENEMTVRGTDPPRVDQLLSQGYGVFGKLQDLLEANEEQLGDFLTHLGGLLKELNRMLAGKERQRVLALIDNLSQISEDVRRLLQKAQGPQGQELAERLLNLLRKADAIGQPEIRKFFQDEGIRARIF